MKKLLPPQNIDESVAARKPRTARTTQPAAAKKVTPGANPIEDIRDAVARLKRERIISTAVDLFHQHGLSNTTLEAVAEQMNVTKPFIYSHFKSKNELLAEICSRGIRASLDVLNRVLDSTGSATDKVRTLTHDFMLAVLENQGHIAIYTREEKHLSPESRKEIDHMRQEFDRTFCALLNEGVRSGEFAVDDVQMTSLAIGGMVGWSSIWYCPDGRMKPSDIASKTSDLVLKMIQVRPAAY